MRSKRHHDIGTQTMKNITTMVMLILIPHLLIYCYSAYTIRLDQRLDELTDIAVMLGQSLDKQSLALLGSVRTSGLTQEQQVFGLNQALQRFVQECATKHPGVGLGIYSKNLNSTVAVVPFTADYLCPVAADSPYLRSYDTLKLERLATSTSISWNGLAIAAATYPIIQDGEVIGHTWANRKLSDILADVASAALALTLCYALAGLLIYLVLRRSFGKLRAGVHQIAADAISGKQTESPVMPELTDLLQALQETRTLAERLFQMSVDPIGIFDRHGILQSANPSFVEMLGFSSEDLIGRSIRSLVVAEDEGKYQHGGEILHMDQALSSWDLRLRRKDGQIRWTSWSCVSDQSTGAIYATARDCTELKQLEEKVRRLDRLDLAGQMAAAISHEIRNPMTAVRGYLQLMKIRSESPEQSDRLDLMIGELDRANSIISEFLALAKNQEPARAETDLNAVITRLTPLLEADCLTRKCLLRIDLADVSPLVLDEKEIRQLLFNLVRNSLDAMPNGGELLVQTCMQRGKVCLAVEDQGSGIPAAVLDRIWEPFFTTKESGTGLGLAVCYRIALENCASIAVPRTGPSGTRIEVTFPV